MDFTKPTFDPVPYIGLQYIAIPEFADAGTTMTQYLAEYVTDRITLDQAIRQTQEVFDRVARDGNYRK
jgi:sorbitol/mannitol transport system substrate-binding protein